MTKQLTPNNPDALPLRPSRSHSRATASQYSGSHQSAKPSQSVFRQILMSLRRMLGLPVSNPTRSRRRRSITLNWVIPGKLAIGALPRSGDSLVLAKGNIGAILSLCSEHEGPLPEDVATSFRCGRVMLPDSYYASSIVPEELLKAVEVVHRCVQRNIPIYVHCLCGIERAPLVCITYLCLHRDLDLMEALLWLKQIHPRANPTEDQLQILVASLSQARADAKLS